MSRRAQKGEPVETAQKQGAITPERLAAIKVAHQELKGDRECSKCGHFSEDSEFWYGEDYPCEVVQLVAEVERLRETLAFYASNGPWDWEEGARARQALGLDAMTSNVINALTGKGPKIALRVNNV
jgi:hypothetical protein